jgi:glycosyltransferase involved in cell wall biosynthesis
MRVLYISKAMVAGAYRDKLRELANRVELRAVVPERWGRRPADAATADEPWLDLRSASLHGHNHLHTYHRASAILDGPRPDIVHIDEEPYSAVTAQLARECARRSIPFVFFAWQNIEKRVPPPFARVRGYVFRRARGGLAGTAAAARVLRAWGWAGPIGVIPQMGVDPVAFRPDTVARERTRSHLGADDSTFVIGFGGRLVAEKGVHLLLRAAALMAQARLVFVGDGPERDRIRTAAAAAGMADRVHIEGDVPSRDVPAWLNGFDVLVLPSVRTRGWMEQFGRILVEAMACGVPVAGSTSGEIPNVIGNAGLVFAENDACSLAGVLRRLAASPAERAAMGRTGRARVLENWTNQRIAGDTVSFYESILGMVA